MMDLQTLVALFSKPQPEHTACPFWFWNGDLNPDELIRQIHLMHEKGICAFFIHARKGLTVPYLSEEWFDRCRLVIEEAARLGMKVWIYDEDNWPSGYAGGRVVARNPNFVGQNLNLERHYVQGPKNFQLKLACPEEVRAVAAVRIAEIRPITPNPLISHLRLREGKKQTSWFDRSEYEHIYAKEEPLLLTVRDDAVSWDVPEGYWCVMVFRQQPTKWFGAYSHHLYPDLMNEGAVDAFLEETHEQYYRRFKEHFGKTVLGFFVDEPGLYNNFWDRNVGSIPWTHDFADEFEKRRGYDLLRWLPALWEDLGERTEQIRFDFWLTVTELLEERFFGKLAKWCSEHGVMLTGHLEWEEWLFTMTRHSGNPFKALCHFHVPGVDKIDEVTEKLAEKMVASIAHINGRQRVLSETFANIGWKLSPPYMKQIVDYQFVRGINWLCCHAFYFSIDDYRKFESPPSEFFQNPWWEHSKPLWDYVARLSAVLSQGNHVAPVALYYPIEQAWATMTPEAPKAFDGRAWELWQLPEKHLPVQQTDQCLIRLGLCLLENQYDFDLLDYSALTKAEIAEGQLKVGQERFLAMVVPSVDILVATSLRKMLAFAESGGTVIFVNKLPNRVVNGDMPKGWEALHHLLSSFSLPDFVKWGKGQIGFVPQGIEATVVLLRKVVLPDALVEISPDDDQILIWQENRFGLLRETYIRSLRHAIKVHRRVLKDADIYFIVNESDRSFTATLRLVGRSVVEEWVPHKGERKRLPSTVDENGRTVITLPFGAWQSYLLVLKEGTSLNIAPSYKVKDMQILTDWQIRIGEAEFSRQLVSWHDLGLAWYSGIGVYRTTFTLDRLLSPKERLILDLGTVLETAQICINGVALPPLAFPPYQAEITAHVQTGQNELVITVANTNANAFEHRERPSGLLGPVRVILQEKT